MEGLALHLDILTKVPQIFLAHTSCELTLSEQTVGGGIGPKLIATTLEVVLVLALGDVLVFPVNTGFLAVLISPARLVDVLGNCRYVAVGYLMVFGADRAVGTWDRVGSEGGSERGQSACSYGPLPPPLGIWIGAFGCDCPKNSR